MYSGNSMSTSLSAVQSYRCRIFTIVLCAVLIGGISTEVSAQAVAGPEVSLDVDDPRPVAEAVQSLVKKYGYQITYEDPPFVYQGDLADRNVKGLKDRIPAGGALSLRFTPSSRMSTPTDMAGLLEKLLQVHAVSDTGGHFRLVQNEQVFHVIPSEAKDPNGSWVSKSSILDAAISLPNKERAEMAMLEEICAAVGAATHTRVVVGTIPGNAILPHRGMLSAENEIARSVLMRALDGTNRRLTWILLYDPNDREYFLNILVVPTQFGSSSAPGSNSASTDSLKSQNQPQK
jgi:hypothetical protein